jgi:lactoylglutathione lyase
MHVEPIALWIEDFERLWAFYERYFGAVPGVRYVNPAKGFRSPLLYYESAVLDPDGNRLEITV